MKELTSKEYHDLWWEDWPYSEVELIEQQRILDDKYARRYLQIKFFINPTTYRICKKNIENIKNDYILSIFDCAKLKPWYWYQWIIHSTQYTDEDSRKKVLEIKKNVENAIFEMHKFVMDNYLR